MSNAPLTLKEREAWLAGLQQGDAVTVRINGKPYDGYVALSGIDDVFVEGESIPSGSFYRYDGASHDPIRNAVIIPIGAAPESGTQEVDHAE